MKHRILLCLLAAIAIGMTATVRAGIVLDDNPQDAPPTKPMDVPKPKDGAAVPGTPGDQTPPSPDALRFVNNDTLHGTFLGYDNGGIRFQSLESKDPISFQTSNLSEVKLDSHRPPANATPAANAVTLTNNDELPGVLVSLDDKTLILDTWYAGKLSIPRAMIKSIVPLKASASILYQGPTSMDGWTVGPRGMNNRSWTYRDGTFLSSNYGILGRDMKLPDQSAVDFDLIARGNSQVSICVYSDRTDNMSNCYMFQINNGSVYLQRFSRDGSNNFGEQVQLHPEAMHHDKMHIGIRVNKATKTLWLFVNGVMLKQWTDPAEFAGKGGSLLFMSQPGMYTRVSNIVVSSWDGQIDNPAVTAAKSKEDNIKMENQDKVSGKLMSIADGKAAFKSSYADLTIPLDRIEMINMSNDDADMAKRNANDVRAYFSGRGSITMQLESWDAKQATATSPNFGKASFSPDAFQKLQFNLNKQPAGDDSSDAGAGAGADMDDQ